MTEAETSGWLEARGLRLPTGEIAAFTALLEEMAQAAAVARAPLSYECEPAATFKLAQCQPASPVGI